MSGLPSGSLVTASPGGRFTGSSHAWQALLLFNLLEHL